MAEGGTAAAASGGGKAGKQSTSSAKASARRAKAQRLFNQTARAQLGDGQLEELKQRMAALRRGEIATPEFCAAALEIFRAGVGGGEESLSLLVRSMGEILPRKFRPMWYSLASGGQFVDDGGGLEPREVGGTQGGKLYIGGWGCVQSLASLRRHGITHVLTVASEVCEPLRARPSRVGVFLAGVALCTRVRASHERLRAAAQRTAPGAAGTGGARRRGVGAGAAGGGRDGRGGHGPAPALPQLQRLHPGGPRVVVRSGRGAGGGRGTRAGALLGRPVALCRGAAAVASFLAAV
jgi:hypothetical protein